MNAVDLRVDVGSHDRTAVDFNSDQGAGRAGDVVGIDRRAIGVERTARAGDAKREQCQRLNVDAVDGDDAPRSGRVAERQIEGAVIDAHRDADVIGFTGCG